jgi:type III secretion system FlhB-like substrate exporter
MKESAKKSAEQLIGKGKGIINSIPNVSGSNHTEVSVEEVTSRLDKLKQFKFTEAIKEEEYETHRKRILEDV